MKIYAKVSNSATTIATLNKWVSRYGYEIVRGAGYHYFVQIDPYSNLPDIPSIYEPYTKQLTVREVVRHVEEYLGIPVSKSIIAKSTNLVKLKPKLSTKRAASHQANF